MSRVPSLYDQGVLLYYYGQNWRICRGDFISIFVLPYRVLIVGNFA